MNQELLDLVSHSATLPTMPQVVVRFLEISADERCEIQQLITVLKTDPGISSELLRMSNSALFGVTRQVSSLQQAVTLLGLNRVRTLVLGRYLVDRLDARAASLKDFSFSYYWRRALSTAVLAARFADFLAPKQREEAFIAGLLADTGVVALLQAIPKRYGPLAAEYAPLHGNDFTSREQAELGLTHADVSAMILEKWMLPPAVVEAVRQHHVDDLPPSSGEAMQLARIINVASRLGRILCEKPEQPVIAEACHAATRILHLDAASLLAALSDIETVIRDFANLLRIYIVRSNVFLRISEILSAELAGKTEDVPVTPKA